MDEFGSYIHWDDADLSAAEVLRRAQTWSRSDVPGS
jgi:hypothetical protein